MALTRRKITWLAGIAALIVAMPYGFNAWWLMTYGRSPQPVPSTILEVDKGFNFPPGFPPDPGSAGKQTIQGIDSDHDGVRDDIQRWIYAFVPNDPKKQMALRQMARYYTEVALADDYSHDVIVKGDVTLDRAIQCLDKAYDDGTIDVHGSKERKYLKAKTLNTYSRVRRYWENDSKITVKEAAGFHPTYDTPCDNH